MLPRTTIAALVWLMCVSISGASACKDHCKSEPCVQFNGNLTEECGDCDDTAACHPGAADFDTWHARRELNQTLIEEDKTRGTDAAREEL